MRVKITLDSYARQEAKNMRELRGIETPEAFEGPEFTNVQSVKRGKGWVIVVLEDGGTYSYKTLNVDRISTYPE